MKKYSILLAIALLGAYNVEAQVELNADDINSELGLEFIRTSIGLEDTGGSGENQTWDFAGLPIGQTIDTRIIAAGTTGLEELYPNSNYLFELEDGVANEFYTLADSGLYLDGQYEEVALELAFTDPQLLIPFPASIGVIADNIYNGAYSSSSLTGVVTGSAALECDATGTLIMPWGTVENVVRVRSVITQGEIVDAPGGEVEVSLNGEIYSWFAPGFPGPIVVMRDLVVIAGEGGNPTPVQSTLYINDISLSLDQEELVENLNVFPNPAKDYFTINYDAISPESIHVELLDIQGRVVKSIPFASAGVQNVNLEIQVDDLNDGLYILRLSSQDRTQTAKVFVGN